MEDDLRENIDYISSECTCSVCVDMCVKFRPCWGTARDIESLIGAGFASRLMLVYHYREGGIPVQILSPAIKGHEGRFAPTNPYGRCTFLNDRNRCELHDLGLKPTEGRAALCSQPEDPDLVPAIAATWLSNLGISLVMKWHEGEL